MEDFPTLTEMGITRPRQITRYTLTQVGHTDVLRIHYKREKGSILPKSRKYQFDRQSKGVSAGGGRNEPSEIFEISPFLLKAIADLDHVVGDAKSLTEAREVLLRQVDEIERSMHEQLEEIRAEIEHCVR